MNYLSKKRNELPLNVMFNKVKVGCGGTTLALTSPSPYVICVPYVSLIDNKIAQNTDKLWLGVKSGITKEMIYEYLNECYENEVAPKILVTYDSLPKVTECIDPQEFYILIDEYHTLFQQYSFRYEAIQSVLNLYKRYKAFTFMTATPLDTDVFHTFILDELKDIPVITQEWEDDEKSVVEVEAIQCTSVKTKVIDIIEKHLSGEIEGNAYFFVNSCKFINDIYENSRLNNDNCRVIYSRNNTQKYNFERGETTDQPKKINFLTSTTFEGADIYDENGMTYIVSDANKQHTLLDINSSVQQIIGRIRDSRYKGIVMHIYSKDRYIDTDPSKFEEAQQKIIKDSRYFEGEASKMESKAQSFIQKVDEAIYTSFKEGAWRYDDNLRLFDLYNYMVRTQYKCKTTIDVAYQNIGADVKVMQWREVMKKMSVKGISFKEAVKECREAENEDEIINTYSVRFPILREAIDKLGYKKIETLRYSQKAIKDQLLLANNKGSVNMKVISKLNLKNGAFYTLDDLKAKLQKAYDLLGVKATATGKGIEELYSCEFCRKKVIKLVEKKDAEGNVIIGRDGKPEREPKEVSAKGYIIYLPLFKKMQ